MGRLKGKVAIVAGASRGIGRATAEAFAKEGARLVLLARHADDGQRIADGIGAAGGEAIFVRTDVTDPESVEKAIAAAVERYGRIDVAFNAAGGSGSDDGPVTTASLDEFWNKMRVDLLGTFLVCRFIIPEMAKAGGGSIINMASMAGFGSFPARAAYSTAKGGVFTLTRATARQFAPQRIRVNAIAPSAVRTERIEKLLAESAQAREMVQRQVLGLIEPAEIAHAAVYLASDESRTLTGQIIGIHGGQFGD